MSNCSTSSANYTGPDIYGALHRVNGVGTIVWTVANRPASGLRVRFNSGDGKSSVAGLFLLKTTTPSLQFTAVANTMEASDIFTSRIERLDTAQIRFVMAEGGAFYISEALPNFAVAQFCRCSNNRGAVTGSQTSTYSIHALEAA